MSKSPDLSSEVLQKILRKSTPQNPFCVGCGRSPYEIDEYVLNPEGDPDTIRFVRKNEGTFNQRNGHFACTECYIKLGQPSSPSGWVAP